MARAGIRDVVFGLAAAGLLMGCVEGGGTTSAGDGAGVLSSPAKKKGGAQDVEAPEVFETTDSALWDGRPSLGGIWVAAPEVTNPERAVLFNPATGKSVTGALFKRERDNPGPRLQLSSDAAEALGILAGQPTEIRVTALRKAEVEEAAPAAEETPAPAEGEAEAKPAKEAQDVEAAAIASAALAAVDAEAPKVGETAAKTEDANDADPAAAAAAAGAAAVAADGAAAAVDEAPKRKTWKERRAEARAAREAKKKAAAEAAAAASAAEADAAMAATEAPTATPETAAVAPIESAPLDARKPEVAAGTEAAPKRKTVGQTPEPEPAAEAEAASEPAPAPVVASGPVRPIQVASFSKEDNAKRASEALAKIGVTATPQKSEKDGKAVWGVIVQGDDAMLKKIKDAGFADAYFLK